MKLVDLYEFVDPEQRFTIYINEVFVEGGAMSNLSIDCLMCNIYSIGVEPDEDNAIKIELQR